MGAVDVLGDQGGQERDQRDRRGLGRSGTLATTGEPPEGVSRQKPASS